jgi:protein gp37
MGQTTIEWTATRDADGIVTPGYTFNPWWGCVKVSEACRNCYAATFAKRFGVEWGPQARRRFFGDAKWREPLKWDRKAAAEGVRRRVFCASMADVFEVLPDRHPDAEQMGAERLRLWRLIEATPHLDWLLLTKRPENVLGLTPAGWDCVRGFPENVWVGTTAETQECADERIPRLLEVPARVRFLSMEPLLGPVDLSRWLDLLRLNTWVKQARWMGTGIHWVIGGGESGPGARPTHLEWARGLRDQCEAAGVPFFWKQWGCWCPGYTTDWEYWTQLQNGKQWATGAKDHTWPDGARAVNLGKKQSGRLLDGREWDEMPA